MLIGQISRIGSPRDLLTLALPPLIRLIVTGFLPELSVVLSEQPSGLQARLEQAPPGMNHRLERTDIGNPEGRTISF